MKKTGTRSTLELYIQLEIGPEKRKALEMYNKNFLAELQAEMQRDAEKSLRQVYSRTVPKAIREYVERCEKIDAGETEKC